MTQFKGLTSFATLTSVCHLPTSKIIGVDCHSAPCFKVDLFQSNLYSVLDFTTCYILNFRSLLKNNVGLLLHLLLLSRIVSCYNL